MKTHSSATRPQLLAITLLALAAYACGGASTAATPAATLPPNLPEHITIQGITWGSGPFTLEDPKVGLSDLSSYTATLTLAFDGTKDGNTQKWTKTYVMLASADPQVRALTVQKGGNLTNLDNVNVAERGGAHYSWQGDNTCTAKVVEQSQSLSDFGEPAGFLSFVVGADEAGSEKVNDIPSSHYTFDGHALAQQDLAQSIGELWVATDGGYVVKYLVTTKGKSDYFGEGIEGTLSYDYELTGVNKPVKINIPADCPPGLVDAPQLPDASNVDSELGLLTYTTASSFHEAAAFYHKELPKLGWQATGDPSATDDQAESDVLTFEKDGETMIVTATAENGATIVQIALLRSQ